jgi:hypothetical protein
MKRYIVFLWALALTTLSCSEDKGSYDYKEINEVYISGLASEYRTVHKVGALKITPELTFTQDDDPNRYEYVWEVGSPLYTTSAPTATIGQSRDLDYFPELAPGDYALFLKVTDKKTGIRWINQNKVILHVLTQVSRGFLLIGEDEEGYADVDMISMTMDTVVAKGLLRGNGLPPLRDPIGITFTGEGSTSNAQYIKLWVQTGDGTYFLDLTTLEGKVENNLKSCLFTTFDLPDDISAEYFCVKNATALNGVMNGNHFVVCDNGYAFFSAIALGGFRHPINRSSTTSPDLYKLFPYIFTAVLTSNTGSGVIFYDVDNNRFLYSSYLSYANATGVLVDAPGDVFDWQQPPGRELVYGENTPNKTNNDYGSSYALMKDTGPNWHIYRFCAGNGRSPYITSPVKLGNYDVDLATARDIEQARLFAFASTRTLMFYAVGNTLYAYDYNARVLYEMPLDDEITMMEFDLFSNRNFNELYIATYNPTTKGKLQKYLLGPDPNSLDLHPDEKCCWNGLVKVVDMDWRNSTM